MRRLMEWGNLRRLMGWGNLRRLMGWDNLRRLMGCDNLIRPMEGGQSRKTEKINGRWGSLRRLIRDGAVSVD